MRSLRKLVVTAACLAVTLAGCSSQQSVPAARTGTIAQEPAVTTPAFSDDYGSAAYLAWQQDRERRLSQPDGYAASLDGYFTAASRQFLSGADGVNRVFSPLNVYMALAMLASITDGASRQQILTLLGAADMAALTTQVGAIYESSSCDDGVVTSLLAASLWLSQDVEFNQKTLAQTAAAFHASAFSGTMGSPAFDAMLQKWLDDNTGGLLTEQAQAVTMDPQTVMALAATLYFKASWADGFDQRSTAPQVFHASAGDVKTDFMHDSRSRTFYRGDRFSAVTLPMSYSGAMWLIMPDEGTDLDTLLADPQVMATVLGRSAGAAGSSVLVNLALPKFDVSSQQDLIAGLRQLGVTDIFDGSVSDFTPLTTATKDLAVTAIDHAARVKIDEQGVVAAAFTIAMIENTAIMDQQTVDFVLDRPFIFAITGADGLPLMVGTVVKPEA